MVITRTAGPRLQTPFYAATGVQGVALHRYLDPEFLPRFLDDVNHSRRENLARSQDWLQDDRFSRHDQQPVMRLPIHRCFYLLSCEVCCARPGQPPLDPRAISSAGFAIRQGPPGGTVKGWKLRHGRPQGWKVLSVDEQKMEPDEYRYLLSRNLVRPRSPEPPYSGELTHPLFPVLVQGEERKHTVLHGFIPLGGSLTLPLEKSVTASAQARRNRGEPEELQKELFWPFGSAEFAVPVPLQVPHIPGIPGIAPDPVTPQSSVRAWSDTPSHQVAGGRPTFAFFQLLDVLVQRIKVGRSDSRAGEALNGLLKSVRFSRDSGNHRYDQARLYQYIRQQKDTLGPWLNDVRLELEKGAAPLPDPYLSQGLPKLASDVDLILSEEEAESFRLVMAQQLESDLQDTVMDLPVPRFQQGIDDLYHAYAFIRTLDDCGHEQFHEGLVSTPFRVAAPADPEATRPHLIQLPELADLTRGAAKGVAMLAPAKLAEKLESIKLDPEVGTKATLGRPGISWIYSFSIPAVTICAMILLMILVNLLDIIFRWMPWVIVRIPIFSGLRSEEPE